MKNVLRGALVTVASATAINLALYLCQHLLGWSDALRYGTGALLLLLGAFSVQGDGPKEALLAPRLVELGQVVVLRGRPDVAPRKGVSAGWLLVATGTVTFGFTPLLP